MDVRRLRLGEWTAAASGAALLAFTFLPWFVARPDFEEPPPGYEPLASQEACVPSPCGARPANAWEAFAAIDLFVLLAALAGLALAVVTAAYVAPAVPVGTASLTTLAGILATVLVLFRIAIPPGSGERLAGLWLGLLGCAGVAAGAWLALRDEGFGLRPGLERSATQPDRAPEVGATPLPPPLPREGDREAGRR